MDDSRAQSYACGVLNNDTVCLKSGFFLCGLNFLSLNDTFFILSLISNSEQGLFLQP